MFFLKYSFVWMVGKRRDVFLHRIQVTNIERVLASIVAPEAESFTVILYLNGGFPESLILTHLPPYC